MPGEYNDVGGDYIVRSSDAHTWVEVFLPRLRLGDAFDPTPGGNGRRSGMISRLGLYWDWFQFTWGQWVINYDFSHQINLAQNIQKTSRNWGERSQRYYREKQRDAIRMLLVLDKKMEASPYFLPGILVSLVALFA